MGFAVVLMRISKHTVCMLFRNRAYFAEITILIPESWSDDPSYSAPNGKSFSSANVVIENPSSSNVTRVVRPSQDCGTVDHSAQMLTSSTRIQEETVETLANVRRII